MASATAKRSESAGVVVVGRQAATSLTSRPQTSPRPASQAKGDASDYEKRAELRHANKKVAMPAGCPPWVAGELVNETIRTWQRYYPHPLTPDDALEIIMNVGQLLDVTGRCTSAAWGGMAA